MTKKDILEQNEIIRILNGSRLYGTHTDESDYDYIGVYVEPPEYLFSLKHLDSIPLSDRDPEAKTSAGEEEGMAYSLRHYIQLCLNGNPSLLAVLFAPEEFWETATPEGNILMNEAGLFASKKPAPRFKGYMLNQLQRLEGIKKGHIPNRPELVEKYGHDTKYAMQIARLALQGIEYFRIGSITSPMQEEDIEYLRAMREGVFSYEQVLREVKFLEEEMINAIEKSTLPDEPDYAGVHNLSRRLHERTWRR